MATTKSLQVCPHGGAATPVSRGPARKGSSPGRCALILKKVFFAVFLVTAGLAVLSCGGGSSDPPAALSPTSPVGTSPAAPAGRFALIAWNDLGMHCIDHDYSVFAILPPYNNLHAQLIDRTAGKAISAGVSLTYEAAADATGSINTSSATKTNFWDWVLALFGAQPSKNVGLTGNPVQSGVPAAMSFDTTNGYWKAEGVPTVPYDDQGNTNYYPMVKVVAKDAAGTILASTKTVLPISDEMTCVHCHASTTGDPAAQPAAGWVNDPDPGKDWKRNILRLHDDRNLANATYTAALAAKGYQAAGLLATSDAGKPILCASCHASNALGTAGFAGIPQLTISIHSWHGIHAMDDNTGLPLDSTTNRSACYYCHPGSTTQCLRGVMGNAKSATGALLIECQSCHGSMSAVGASTRIGWQDLPRCDGCHYPTTGGYVRDVSAFDSTGVWRSPSGLFGTGTGLYKLSASHGMQCEACHGSTHAEYPCSEANDNVQSSALQGYAGKITECTVCHASVPLTADGGPHGMHTLGQTWVSGHADFAKGAAAPCATCHGSNYDGSFLSKIPVQRTFNLNDAGTKIFPAGHMVSCYDCHNGPTGNG